MTVTLHDLMFLKFIGVRIDEAIFASALAFENRHMNLTPCRGCGVQTLGYHAKGCPDGSVLTVENWYERCLEFDSRGRFGNLDLSPS